MGALACTPTGQAPVDSFRPQLGANLLPGENLVAFAQWRGPAGDDGSSLTVYASGHVDYRVTSASGFSGNPGILHRRDFRVSDAAMNDVWALMRLLSAPDFAGARRSYVGERGLAGESLYSPSLQRTVDVVAQPDHVPAAVAEALGVLNSLRTDAREKGVDPFSPDAKWVASPELVLTRHFDTHTREVTVFDRGSVEVRSLSGRFGGEVESFALSGRLRAGTLLELRRLIEDFDDGPVEAACDGGRACGYELITPRTRRWVSARGAAPTRALIEAVEHSVAGLG